MTMLFFIGGEALLVPEKERFKTWKMEINKLIFADLWKPLSQVGEQVMSGWVLLKSLYKDDFFKNNKRTYFFQSRNKVQ